LADIMLTNETLNWEGDKRCCMSATGVRQLEEIEGLTSDDYSAISEKVLQKDNTREFCKGLLPALANDLQSCLDEFAAEAEEIAEAERTAIAEAALEEAKTYAETAANARLEAETAAESANTTSTSKAAESFATEAAQAATRAQNAANASADAAERAADAGSAGDAAVDAQQSADDAELDAELALNAAELAQARVEELQEKEAEEEAERIRLNGIRNSNKKPKVTAGASDFKASMFSVISVSILYYSLVH